MCTYLGMVDLDRGALGLAGMYVVLAWDGLGWTGMDWDGLGCRRVVLAWDRLGWTGMDWDVER